MYLRIQHIPNVKLVHTFMIDEAVYYCTTRTESSTRQCLAHLRENSRKLARNDLRRVLLARVLLTHLLRKRRFCFVSLGNLVPQANQLTSVPGEVDDRRKGDGVGLSELMLRFRHVLS